MSRTQTINREVFTFAELSDTAKTKALADYAQTLDYDWWGFVIDDAKECASIIGIEIEKVFFSGFCSQGDGASFTGSYAYKKGSVKAIKVHAPLDTELHYIALQLQREQCKSFYKIKTSISQHGRYYHEQTMHFDHDHVDRYLVDSDVDDIEEALKDFARWIYKRLENEWDYMTSLEAFAETCECNEWEFTVNGKLV